MNLKQIDEVWSMVDRDYLAQVAQKGPKPVFATISGAHLYGFASPDSDVDMRGAYLLSAKEVLGLHPPAETWSHEDKSRMDLDWVAHDIRKFARLMTNHNGYVLEQLFSPLVVISTPAHLELLDLGKGCFSKPTVNHYLGFARGRRKRLQEPHPTVKHLLYCYRVLLTGIHLMRYGEIVANIEVLNEDFKLSEVADLVERKRMGAEKMGLDLHEIELHGTQLDRLEGALHVAHDESQLPMEPTTSSALEDLVIRLRLETERG